MVNSKSVPWVFVQALIVFFLSGGKPIGSLYMGYKKLLWVRWISSHLAIYIVGRAHLVGPVLKTPRCPQRLWKWQIVDEVSRSKPIPKSSNKKNGDFDSTQIHESVAKVGAPNFEKKYGGWVGVWGVNAWLFWVWVGGLKLCLLVGVFKYFCMFHPTWGHDPIWLYNSFQMGGLNPPTGLVLVHFFWGLEVGVFSTVMFPTGDACLRPRCTTSTESSHRGGVIKGRVGLKVGRVWVRVRKAPEKSSVFTGGHFYGTANAW